MNRTEKSGKALITYPLNIALTLLFLLFTATSASVVQLRGVVVDSSRNPVSGVFVSLPKTTLLDTTDATGSFILNSSTGIRLPQAAVAAPTTLKVLPGRLVFAVPHIPIDDRGENRLYAYRRILYAHVQAVCISCKSRKRP